MKRDTEPQAEVLSEEELYRRLEALGVTEQHIFKLYAPLFYNRLGLSEDDADRIIDSGDQAACRALCEVTRLRARERQLVERVRDHIEWLHARGYYPVAEELRAALGKP
jgi:hypothetical protein